jgi:hypothetical protein
MPSVRLPISLCVNGSEDALAEARPLAKNGYKVAPARALILRAFRMLTRPE